MFAMSSKAFVTSSSNLVLSRSRSLLNSCCDGRSWAPGMSQYLRVMTPSRSDDYVDGVEAASAQLEVRKSSETDTESARDERRRPVLRLDQTSINSSY